MGLLRDLVARGHGQPVRLAYAAGTPENLACLDEIAAAGAKLDLRPLLLSETPSPDWTGETGWLDRERLLGHARRPRQAADGRAHLRAGANGDGGRGRVGSTSVCRWIG